MFEPIKISPNEPVPILHPTRYFPAIIKEFGSDITNYCYFEETSSLEILIIIKLNRYLFKDCYLNKEYLIIK